MAFATLKNGLRVFYNIAGAGTRTVVLIHGAGATCRLWSLQMRPLIDVGYKVVTYDVRGHGATEGIEGMFTIADLAADLAELLEQIGIDERVFVCGISMGGLIAQEFALAHPEKLRGLVLANTYSFLGEEAVAAATGLSAEALREKGVTAELVYEALKPYLTDDMNVAAHMAQAADILLPAGPGRTLFFDDALFQKPAESLKTKASTGAFDSRGRIDAIDCPTLIIGSEKDMIVPFAESAYLHEHIAGSRYVALPGNHVSNQEDPETFNRLILDFIGGIAEA